MFDTDIALVGAWADLFREFANLSDNIYQMDIEERTRNLAHELWKQAGEPEGDGQSFWFEAERILRGAA